MHPHVSPGRPAAPSTRVGAAAHVRASRCCRMQSGRKGRKSVAKGMPRRRKKETGSAIVADVSLPMLGLHFFVSKNWLSFEATFYLEVKITEDRVIMVSREGGSVIFISDDEQCSVAQRSWRIFVRRFDYLPLTFCTMILSARTRNRPIELRAIRQWWWQWMIQNIREAMSTEGE